jgi:hypothetical protein
MEFAIAVWNCIVKKRHGNVLFERVLVTKAHNLSKIAHLQLRKALFMK